MIKVSILVPTYNVKEYLAICLNSIINQTLKEIEVICIDDGSTDGSGEILDKYAKIDNRILVIHKKNEGYGKAMNVGMNNARGEYIGIVEPDDYIGLNMYEDLYRLAKEYDVDFIKSDFYRFTGSGTNINRFYNKLDRTEKYYNKIIDINKDTTPFKFTMNTWSGIYNTNFLKTHNIKYNETPGASFQDNGFWFQTFMYGRKIYFINKAYYMNRRDNPNSSIKNKQKVFAMTNEYKYIRSIIDSHHELHKFIRQFWPAVFRNYIFTLKRIDRSFYKTFAKQFIDSFATAKANSEIDLDAFEDFGLRKSIILFYKNPKKYLKSVTKDMNIFERFFSIKNLHVPYEKKHKVLCIFGHKIDLKK